MKKAFTMIELIFVIVIIGILAAVAIPKLSASRHDASVSTIMSNAKIAITDFQKYYTSQGNTVWNNQVISSVTKVTLLTSCDTPTETNISISPNTFLLCHDDVACLSFKTTEAGLLITADGTDTTDPVCEDVKNNPAIKNISNQTFVLGGIKIAH